MSTDTLQAPRSSEPRPRSRRRLAAVATAVAAIGAVVLAAVVFLPSDDPEPAMELSLGTGDGLASCLAFDVSTLAAMSPAFEGTVTGVEGERITLHVDRWFAGGDSEEVALISTAGMTALIGGIDFTLGDQYLITAAGGQVNFCGYSGPATSEFRGYFEQAFAA